MEITRSRTLRFNTGAYEHLETTASVTFNMDELPGNVDHAEFADQTLDELQKTDIARADETSRTPEENTFLHGWMDTL